nr:retrovirus-related Pol polyprotein from transposon TNT 1-94 [Tanacetum cinerariifolium]
MRNKPDIETLSMDDLYNNLKVYEAKIKGQSSLGFNSHNVAFVSSENTSNINGTVTAAHDIFAYGSKEQPSASSYVDDVMFSFFASQSNTPQLDNEDLEQIDIDDLEEMDLKWQVAIITIRVKKFMKRTGRNLNFNGKEPVGFDKTKVKCYNCHRVRHFARECHAPRNQGNRIADNERRVVPVKTPASALVVQDGLGGYDWSYQAKEGPTDFALMAYSSDSANSLNSELNFYPHTHPESDSQSSMIGALDLTVLESSNPAKDREVRLMLNNAKRVNHQNFSKMTHPHPKRNFVPTAVATKSGQVLVNAANQNLAASTSTAKPKGNPQYTLQDQGIFDSGCSSLKGGKITGKGKIRTGKLDFEDFRRMKGIKREFSVSRIPQQNRVAKRNNRTLIEAARTMLADSVLPTTFWAKAVNTACYVQNRVLVTKPHNKTPYELLIGRSPNIEFIRPFGCLVTILNTLDHLGKFDGKADEGFLV